MGAAHRHNMTAFHDDLGTDSIKPKKADLHLIIEPLVVPKFKTGRLPYHISPYVRSTQKVRNAASNIIYHYAHSRVKIGYHRPGPSPISHT